MKLKDNKVYREYSNAITSDSKSIVSQTGNAEFAGYSEDDLSNLPKDIAKHSFGCGNPVAFSDVKSGQTVLDLGCGAGLDLLLASEKVGVTGSVIGIDFNQDMLALARSRTQDYPNIELKQGRIEALPIESNSIDWVISNCVINLSDDKQRAFNEIARVLKNDGRMMVSDIVGGNMPWWVRYSGVMKAACAGGIISEAKYLEGLGQAGLVETEVVARQYYDAGQLASIVSGAAPTFIRTIKCCGNEVLHSILKKLANPVSKNLWSAKISARML